VPIAIVMKFFIMMFAVFFDWVNPASTQANPACIKNTRAAATITHTVLTANTSSTPIIHPPFFVKKQTSSIKKTAQAVSLLKTPLFFNI
jgi:hypothetical protein